MKLEKQIELSSITQPLYLCTWNGSQIVQIHNRETFTKEYESTNMRFDSFDEHIQHLIIKDIVMLFTILGNDFLPKLNIINTNRHIRQILDAYQKINQDIKARSLNYSFIF